MSSWFFIIDLSNALARGMMPLWWNVKKNFCSLFLFKPTFFEYGFPESPSTISSRGSRVNVVSGQVQHKVNEREYDRQRDAKKRKRRRKGACRKRVLKRGKKGHAIFLNKTNYMHAINLRIKCTILLLRNTRKRINRKLVYLPIQKQLTKPIFWSSRWF